MKIIKIFLILLVFVLAFTFINILVAPKYQTSLIEGSFTSEYYKTNKNHDIIILGDCEVYENISPMEMYKTTGVKAYVRGNAQQMIWQSFYLLEETLKYEKPEVVVLSVGALRNGKNLVNEAYNRLVIDKMKWSKEKVDMINVSKKNDESFLSYVFPILRYHSRISELKREDFKYLFKEKSVSYNGFLINKGVKPVESLPTKRVLSSYDFDSKVIEYLDKITNICHENNIKLVLIKAPSLYPYWYEEYDNYVEEYASKHDIKFYNFLDNIEDIGLDYNVDTYDAGLHLNLSGATKLSKYFANILKQEYGLSGKMDDDEYNQMLEEYNRETENVYEE